MPSYCSNCGNPLRDGVKFCTNCGAPVSSYNQTNAQNEVNKTFKPVFSQSDDTQQEATTNTQDVTVETYQQPSENVQQYDTFQHTAETFQQPIYEQTYVQDTSNIGALTSENIQVGDVTTEKKYFGVKNIFLFLLNVAAAVVFFLNSIVIKIDPTTEFEGLEKGAKTTLSFAKTFLYALQTVFGFGKFNSGIDLLDESLYQTADLFKEASDPAITSISTYLQAVGGVGVLFLVLAVLAAIVSLIKLIRRKKGISSNVLSILSSLIGLVIGVVFIVAILFFKDTILSSITAAEGYKILPIDFSLDIFAYIFAAICLILLIISIITIKK